MIYIDQAQIEQFQMFILRQDSEVGEHMHLEAPRLWCSIHTILFEGNFVAESSRK